MKIFLDSRFRGNDEGSWIPAEAVPADDPSSLTPIIIKEISIIRDYSDEAKFLLSEIIS